MYNSIIHHLYIVLYIYHPKSSLLLSPFIPPVPSLHPPPLFPLVSTRLLSVWSYVKKLKMELPYDSEIPLLGMYLRKPEILI